MNKYNRIKQIGEGAFGKAVLVKRKDTSKQCVIKEVNITKMSPKEKEEARKEVAVLAQLKHPNIVSYIESFEEKGSLYIVMNFCSGGDLYGKINEQRGRLFSEDQILDWFVQLCLAIKHIHDRKILHRDIKSQNIFITQSGTVQLGDFGIAKVLNNTMQLAHTCIGTPYYLSPEIVENMPYNNKSDIWSMGCVLYELTTLKHAFEAGNMKNLVLKIIRGSYPPVSPQFSYDLRGLIAQLFKRHPRDRPTVNSILRKNFIMQRVRRLLSAQDLADEFSHTVMHGHKIAKALPPAPKPSADPSKKVVPTPRPGSANKKYDPAAVYGAPANVSRNRLSSEQKKRPSTPGQADWEKKQKERKELEQRRRAEMRKREQEMNERRHMDLIEKQKMARMNKAREEGWKNLVDPSRVNENRVMAAPAQVVREVRPKSPRPLPVPRVNPNDRVRGDYEAYNAYIDKLQQEKRTPSPAQMFAPRNPNIDVVPVAAPRAVPAGPRDRPPQPAPRQFQQVAPLNVPLGPLGIPAAIDQAGRDRYSYNMQLGAQAAQRARVVEDYLVRQREAALNKMRAQKDIYGSRPQSGQRTPVPAPNRGPSPKPGPGPRRGGGGGGALIGRNAEEQEYLEKLRQIRMQNMKDRRMIKGVNVGESADEEKSTQEAEDRKKKVEALKAQAEQWAEMKKNELEKQRKELFQQGKPAFGVPAVPITGALHAIGAADQAQKEPLLKDGDAAKPVVPLTNAMEAVRGANSNSPSQGSDNGLQSERPRTAQQKKKDNILKKLNNKNPSRGKWGEAASPSIPASKEEQRAQWGLPASLTGSLAVEGGEEEENGAETSRSQWGEGKDLHLSKFSLEATSSQMEATTSNDLVVRMPGVDNATAVIKEGENADGTRSRWARKSQVVKALDKMPICQDTVTLGEPSQDISSSPSTPIPPVGVGSTITITKPPVQGSTITLDGASDQQQSQDRKKPRPLPQPPDRSGTIVISRDTPEQLPYIVPTIASPIPALNEEELPSSLHFHPSPVIGPSMHQPTHKQTEQPEASVGETELPSSMRLLDQGGNTPRREADPKCKGNASNTSPSHNVVLNNERKLDTLIEVSESQSLSEADQQVVKNQLKEYMVHMRSQKDSSGNGAAGKKINSSEDKDKGQKKKAFTEKLQVMNEGERDGAKSVQMNLTTGQFDMRNVELLRTCSEPDLTHLFRTMVGESETTSIADSDLTINPSTIRRHHSLDFTALSEKELEGSDGINDEDDFEEEDIIISQEDSEEEKDEDNDADEEDDVKSMMETMQSLLDDDESHDNADKKEEEKTVKFQTKSDDVDGWHSKKLSTVKRSPKVKASESSKGADKDEGEDESEEVYSSTEREEEDVGDDGDDEFEGNDDEDNEEDEIEQEKLQLAAALELGNGDSDDETTFGDEDEEDYDRFGRLEQCREELETQLGVEKLLEVYQAIQQLQEDEDGNMEDGAKLAINMLGTGKQHLFPKIFHLVMSDTAFTEDN